MSDISKETKISPATRTVHWPTGPIDCCEEHARQLIMLNGILGGGHIVHTHVKEGTTCVNCENEAKKEDKS